MIDRAAIFRGEIVRRDATLESRALAAIALRRVSEAFACDPDALRTLHERHDLDDAWKRTCDARAAIAHDAEALRASIALASEAPASMSLTGLALSMSSAVMSFLNPIRSIRAVL